jgi:hypothetical protein
MQAFNVYGHDPVAVGIRSLLIGFSILAGACVVLCLLSLFKGRNKALMMISSITMTAGKADPLLPLCCWYEGLQAAGPCSMRTRCGVGHEIR